MNGEINDTRRSKQRNNTIIFRQDSDVFFKSNIGQLFVIQIGRWWFETVQRIFVKYRIGFNPNRYRISFYNRQRNYRQLKLVQFVTPLFYWTYCGRGLTP